MLLKEHLSYFQHYIMKKTIVILLFLSCAPFLFSQVVILPASDLFSDYSGQIRSTIDKRTSNIEGSPYVFEEFQDGIVYPKNRSQGFTIQLNINAYSEMFEFLFEGDNFEMPAYAFDSIIIAGSTFIPVSEFKNDVVTFYAMEVIDRDGQGNYLVKEYVINLLEATMAKAYHQPTPARYQVFPANYFIYDSGQRTLVPLRNLRRLEKNLDYPNGTKEFIHENHLKPRKIEDLKKLFRYLYPSAK